jgi:hypothetical protein
MSRSAAGGCSHWPADWIARLRARQHADRFGASKFSQNRSQRKRCIGDCRDGVPGIDPSRRPSGHVDSDQRRGAKAEISERCDGADEQRERIRREKQRRASRCRQRTKSANDQGALDTAFAASQARGHFWRRGKVSRVFRSKPAESIFRSIRSMAILIEMGWWRDLYRACWGALAR